MPESKIKRLDGHCPVSGSSEKPYKVILLGLIFLVVGIAFIALVFHNRAPGEQSEMPFLLVVYTVLFFPFFGAGIIYITLKEIFRKKKTEEIRKLYPDEPWKWDYDWDTAGIKDRKMKSAGKSFMFGIFMGLFLVPFNWVAFMSQQTPMAGRLWKLITGVFDVIVVLVFGDVIYRLFRQNKYGTGRLKFISFPYNTGSELKVTFLSEKNISGIRQLKAVLRFIEERYVTDSEGGKKAECYEVYADTLVLSEKDFKYGGLSSLDLKFSLPEQGYETSLSGKPAKYWELEISADTPGIDYQANFLLPVYGASMK